MRDGGQHLVGAIFLLGCAFLAWLMGCGELPRETSYRADYYPTGVTLRVEVLGPLGRRDAERALERRARELGCEAPTITVASMAEKVDKEVHLSTVMGWYHCAP